jgi:hypothetical protein
MEPAAWAENIPFNETRDYVKKVLSNRSTTQPAGPAPAFAEGPPGRPSARATPRHARRREPALMNWMPACPMKRILVLGGTGFVGRAVCEKLAERASHGVVHRAHAAPAHTATACARCPRSTWCRPTCTTTLRCAPGGRRDAVVNLVAILHGSAASLRTGARGAAAPLAAGLPGGGVRAWCTSARWAWGRCALQLPAQQDRRRSRAAGSGLDLTMLRPSVIFGAEDRFLNLFAQLQAVAPVFPLAGGDARFQPVWVEDVAAGHRGRAGPAASIGQVIECAGPQCLRCRTGAPGRPLGGCGTPQIPLPACRGPLQAALMEWLPGEPLMSRDNVDSMRVPNVASGKLPGLQSWASRRPPLEAVAPGYLGRHEDVARAWTAGADGWAPRRD